MEQEFDLSMVPFLKDDGDKEDDAEIPLMQAKSTPQYRHRPHITCHSRLRNAKLLIVTLSAAVTILVVSTLFTWKIQRYRFSCGSSLQEAIANNCNFSVMQYAWIPSICYDPELEGSFEHFSDWKWYKDSEGTMLLSENEVRSGRLQDAYPPLSYDLHQCTYNWKRLRRALENREMVDDIIIDVEHSSWCSKLIMDQPNLISHPTDAIISHVTLKYAECLKI